MPPPGQVLPNGRGMRGKALVALAAMSWGTTGTAASLAPPGATSASIGAVRIVIAGAVLGLLTVAGRNRRDALRQFQAHPLVFVAGAGGIVAYQILFFAAVAQAGVAMATVVAIGASPVLTGLFARIWSNERLSRTWAVATAAAVSGVVLLGNSAPGSGNTARGLAMALGASAAYSAYAVLAAGLVRSGVSYGTVMGGLFGTAAVAMLPVLLATPMSWLLSIRGSAVALELGLISGAMAYLLYGSGLRVIPVATAATVGLVEPATAAVLGVVVLGEHLGLVALGGICAIVASLVILSIPLRRDAPPAIPPPA